MLRRVRVVLCFFTPRAVITPCVCYPGCVSVLRRVHVLCRACVTACAFVLHRACNAVCVLQHVRVRCAVHAVPCARV